MTRINLCLTVVALACGSDDPEVDGVSWFNLMSTSALSHPHNLLCPRVETPRGASPLNPQHARHQIGWEFEGGSLMG